MYLVAIAGISLLCLYNYSYLSGDSISKNNTEITHKIDEDTSNDESEEWDGKQNEPYKTYAEVVKSKPLKEMEPPKSRPLKEMEPPKSRPLNERKPPKVRRVEIAKITQGEKREIERLPIPREGIEGKWTPTRYFTKNQSFGYFFCTKCNKLWMSSRAQPYYEQGCKQCKRYYYPKYMWVNTDTKKYNRDKKYLTDNGKNHREDLCRACQRGFCTIRGF